MFRSCSFIRLQDRPPRERGLSGADTLDGGASVGIGSICVYDYMYDVVVMVRLYAIVYQLHYIKV